LERVGFHAKTERDIQKNATAAPKSADVCRRSRFPAFVEMKLSKEEGLTATYLIFYGLWCLSMSFLSGVIAMSMGGFPALFSCKFFEIWVMMDLVPPIGLLMLFAIVTVGFSVHWLILTIAMAIYWLVSRRFGKTGRKWFEAFIRG
jgi:hypothetical protein